MLEKDKFNIRNFSEARLDILQHPIYQAGSLDGIVSTEVRKRDWGYEPSLHLSSTSTNIAQIWHELANYQGSMSRNNTEWNVYNLDSIQALFKDPIPLLMLLRKEEVIRFLQVIASIKIINNGQLNSRQLAEFKYYLDYYLRFKDCNYNIGPIDLISPLYLAGLFEMSPKGTIRFESPVNFNSRGRMIIQIATPQLFFAEYMQKVYGGGSFVIKPNSSYLWKVTGTKADAFLQSILLPNSAWGETVLMHKIKRLAQVEQ